MLLQKCKLVRNTVKEASELQKKQEKVKRVMEFVSLVQEHSRKMEQTIISTSVIHESFPVFSVPVLELKKVVVLLDETAKSISSEPSKERFGAAVTALQGIDDKIKSQWSQLSKHNHQDLVKMLDILGKILKQDNDINVLTRTITDIEQTWPITSAEITHYRDKLEKGKKKVASLNVSADIQQFLDKLGRGQATIVDLTPEVMNWLESQNMSANISISLK